MFLTDRITIFALIVALFVRSVNALNPDDVWYATKQATNETGIFAASRVHVLRLGPGEDLVESLWRYARVTKIKAASVVSVVGSLTDTNIRYANQEDGSQLHGHFEIVSVVGNIDFQATGNSNNEGSGHIHMSVSDGQGVTVGGHVLSGNVVYTTAEITMLEMSDGLFTRVLDNSPTGSGYYELQVHHTKRESSP
eukprot:gene17528-19969_t